MASKFRFTYDDVLNKQFKGVTNGYDPLEVDTFLDEVLKDYALIETSVVLSVKDYQNLNNQIKELNSKNENLEIELSKAKTRLHGIKETDVVSKDNIDILKRINALEKFLFEHGFDPNKIK